MVDRLKPLHLSIVGGEPLVRFRELTQLLPLLSERGVAVQLVTSAVREIPPEWATIPKLHLVVSIDGLQPEHDARRKPATYDKILTNIKGHTIVVHSTITRVVTSRPGYMADFLEFWSARPEVRKIWYSLLTPQRGEDLPDCLNPEEREQVLTELEQLRLRFPKLELPDAVIKGYRTPPQSPAECIFSLTTANYSADLKTRVTPCQFGGDPDCSKCGCMASAGLYAVGEYRLGGLVPLRTIFKASSAIGSAVNTLSGRKD
jgi:sulfatase maturation enzyme AslB (radical SAM superfamily)